MPNVTVPGANHSTVTLTYDSDANALLARQIAGAISVGLADHTIFAFDNKSGSPPPVPSGMTGEFIQSESGVTLLPAGYKYVVDSAKNADIFGNGGPDERILVGGGNLTFFTAGGTGQIVAGGGNNLIDLESSVTGPWLIETGDGDNTILAQGSGPDTIGTGTGKNLIQLGSGRTFFTTTGSNTVLAGSGSETIDASGSTGKQVIYGNGSSLFFVAGGAATVVGGSGSDTVFGGTGSDLFEGGSGGNNELRAGTGRATLFGGGSGDQLYAGGDKAQALHAGSGNESLVGGFSSGRDTFYGGSGSDQISGGFGKSTFVEGTGTATVSASPTSMNLFEFMKSVAGGSELVTSLTSASQVHILLSGFGSNEIKDALASQTTKDGSVTIKLSDNSTVTFQNIDKLTSSNFSTTSDSGGGSGDRHDHGDHHWGKF
jgi:Ca2+-binding RTX toxin-like protein